MFLDPIPHNQLLLIVRRLASAAHGFVSSKEAIATPLSKSQVQNRNHKCEKNPNGEPHLGLVASSRAQICNSCATPLITNPHRPRQAGLQLRTLNPSPPAMRHSIQAPDSFFTPDPLLLARLDKICCLFEVAQDPGPLTLPLEAANRSV
jgi:hypothetical protein